MIFAGERRGKKSGRGLAWPPLRQGGVAAEEPQSIACRMDSSTSPRRTSSICFRSGLQVTSLAFLRCAVYGWSGAASPPLRLREAGSITVSCVGTNMSFLIAPVARMASPTWTSSSVTLWPWIMPPTALCVGEAVEWADVVEEPVAGTAIDCCRRAAWKEVWAQTGLASAAIERSGSRRIAMDSLPNG